MQLSLRRGALLCAAVLGVAASFSLAAPAQDRLPSALEDAPLASSAAVSRPLPPRTAPARAQANPVPLASGAQPSTTSTWSWQRSAMVCIVGGALLLMLVYGSRRFRESSRFMLALGPAGRAPSGVLEVLGRYPAGRGTLLILLRLDRRILLVSQNGGRTSTGMTTLCEIDDPASVASLLAKTRDDDQVAAVFTSTLKRATASQTTTQPTPARSQPPRTTQPAPSPAHATNDANSLRLRLAQMRATQQPRTPGVAA
jgi:hypothetical protein